MPNDMPGAARYVRTNLATPTAVVGGTPTWRGHAMEPLTVVPQLPGASFEARGRGVFNLDTSYRFPRGVRISGQRGSLDVYFVVGLDGTARTLCYLTDNPSQPTNYLAIRLDSSNRPFLEVVTPLTPFSFATGVLTATGALTNAETVVIDGKTYTIESTLTNVDGHVQQGADEVETLANLAAAINLATGAGTAYAAATTRHATVLASASGSELTATAKAPGTAGNTITTTTTCLSAAWGGATLAGGAGSITSVAEGDPSLAPAAPNYVEGDRLHVRLTWDAANLVDPYRHMTFSINGETIPSTHWSTDPTGAWAPWQPTHLVLGAGLLYLGDADFNGTIESAQVSEVVTP